MNISTENILCKQFSIEKEIIKLVNKSEQNICNKFTKIDNIKEYNQYKIINSMQEAKLDSTHFNWTTGYGFNDLGREKVEEIYSNVFNTEDALVRPNIVSGTHALSLTLSGLLRHNEELIYITGSPYDTLLEVIGVKGNSRGNLIEYGVKYKSIDLNDEGSIDIENVINSISNNTRVIALQRSTGYSDRKAITIDEIKEAINSIKQYKKDIIIMVDNCYGEFIDIVEPSDIGADVVVGSLIKNPGGGLALCGGYIVGKRDIIERISNRLTAPGIGKECGLTFGTTRNTLQGLFIAPHVVAEALKGALLTAAAFSNLGFEVVPHINDYRSDIIQGIKFKDKNKVITFCQGIQNASPVDSYVVPEPWNMPGYDDPVIMAAGGFIQGSSIELSADAPIRNPYYVYYQGGLTYEHCKLGLMKALSNLYKKNMISKELAD